MKKVYKICFISSNSTMITEENKDCSYTVHGVWFFFSFFFLNSGNILYFWKRPNSKWTISGDMWSMKFPRLLNEQYGRVWNQNILVLWLQYCFLQKLPFNHQQVIYNIGFGSKNITWSNIRRNQLCCCYIGYIVLMSKHMCRKIIETYIAVTLWKMWLVIFISQRVVSLFSTWNNWFEQFATYDVDFQSVHQSYLMKGLTIDPLWKKPFSYRSFKYTFLLEW